MAPVPQHKLPEQKNIDEPCDFKALLFLDHLIVVRRLGQRFSNSSKLGVGVIYDCGPVGTIFGHVRLLFHPYR